MERKLPPDYEDKLDMIVINFKRKYPGVNTDDIIELMHSTMVVVNDYILKEIALN